jgi:thiol:disulfide interchange protein DsbD
MSELGQKLATLFETSIQSGAFGLALAIVFLGGLLTSLTPCVYPMIPITVSVFGARKAGTGRAYASLLGTMYVLGIVVTYSGLGLAAGLGGKAFGTLLGSPTVSLAIALLFSAMAASMFGAFELALPPGLQQRLSGVGGAGTGGAFGMGLVAGLIAAPCAGPVLLALLAYVGKQRSPGLGAGLLAVYASGLGVLFWVLATFSVRLPKPGRWMEFIKSVFGIVLLAAALYYAQNAIAPLRRLGGDRAHLTFGLIAVVAGLAAGAVHLSFSESVLHRARKGAGVLLATVGLFVMANAAYASSPGESAGELRWYKTVDEGRAVAQKEQRPLLIDFWANWCGACKELDHVWVDARVATELKRFVLVKVDATSPTPEMDKLLATNNVLGLPAVLIIDRSAKEVDRLTEFVPADKVLTLLRKVQ